MAKKSRRKTSLAEAYGFQDPILQMGYLSRTFTRVFMNVVLAVHIVATLVLLMSDIPLLFWVGVINFLYFLDRAIYINHGDLKLPASDTRPKNLAEFMTPRARRFITSAHNRSLVLGGGFCLNLTKELFETRFARDAIKSLGIQPAEFGSKLEAYLRRTAEVGRNHNSLAWEVNELATAAYKKRKRGQKFITHKDLFIILPEVGGVSAQLFDLFDISSLKLGRAIGAAYTKGD